MAVCKHCGTEIEDGLDYCPNCGQKTDEDFGDFFEPNEGLEEEAYNIFDSPEEFDMDSLLSKEFEQNTEDELPEFDFSAFSMEPEEIPELEPVESVEEWGSPISMESMEAVEELQTEPFAELQTEEIPGEMDLTQLFDFPEEESLQEVEMPSASDDTIPEVTELGGIEFPMTEETDFLALDDLFQDGEEGENSKGQAEEVPLLDEGLEELLAASELASEAASAERKKKQKKAEKEKKSLFQTLFGNVPVDPSTIKKELTPEQIAAKKQKEAEEKKAKAEEKKLASEEKKEASRRLKEEKERQKALAKEEKKAKKMQEAKLILEEMKETRINRLGATIVFGFFAVLVLVIFSGSEMFGYAISLNNAEKTFNKALNNNVKYYNDAYNEIYGLEIKPEDQVLEDKVLTVMFVNKQLNSYNSQMVLGNREAALHSLLMGLHRYGAYYEQSIPLGVNRDMDFVRTQILKELEKEFGVSEDEAELLHSMLDAAGEGGIKDTAKINEDAARAYNLELYEICKRKRTE